MESFDQIAEMNDAPAIIAAGAAIGEPKNINTGQSVVVVPNGYTSQLVSREFKPSHITRRVELHDAKSFVSYVASFNDGNAQVFADTKGVKFVAIIDYHHADDRGPNWTDHIASFVPRKTTEWDVWVAKNERQMSQAEFAQFIEDNMPDVAEPAGNILFDVARTLEAKKNVKFESGIRLSDGETQFRYEEEIRGSAQKGTLEIPEKFVLGLKPFEGGPAYRMEAMLRYRIGEGGELKFWYKLHRPHKILDNRAFNVLEGQIG